MLMLLGTAIGTGELVAEPAAGARYGGSLFWAILFIIVTKALWNEAIGRVSIVTGQSFLESCSAAGRVVAWVPWAWYAVNVVKDFLLRGGIVAIAGLICFELFGPLPFPQTWVSADGMDGAGDHLHAAGWTLLNYGLIWLVISVGGYRLAEAVNSVLCLMFTLCLMACAVAVVPQAAGELSRGLLPRLPSQRGELLMLIALAGIVMSGSTTVYYSAWAEEREMGLYRFVRRTGRRLTRAQTEPQSEEEIRRMVGWVQVNRINVAATYFLGALICLSTLVLGVAVLRPAGVTLSGPQLTSELSLMMTNVAGAWAKPAFYLGAYAAVASTTIGILDGASRMYTQPLRHHLSVLSTNLSYTACQRIIMALMVAGCWSVYVFVPDVLRLVVWMGAVDAPLVGVLIISYAYLGRWYLPRAYRYGAPWTVVMMLVGIVYFGLGVFYVFQRLADS